MDEKQNVKSMEPIQERVLNEAKGNDDAKQVNNWLVTNYVVEVRNAFANYETIRQLRQDGRAFPMQEFHKKNKGRAIIVGSGSSLDAHIDKLKDWPGKIFCSTSQGTSLVFHGRHPDHMCLIDPNTAPPASPEYVLPGGDWGETILTTHPSGPFMDIRKWKDETKNSVYLFRLHDARLEWYRSTLYYAYPWIKSIVIPFLDSTAAQIAVASYLGYDPLYLLGVDYGGKRFRHSAYKDGKWQVDPEDHAAGGTLNDGDAITPEGLGTSPGFLFTKRGPCMCIVMHLYHGFMQRIYNLAPRDRSAMVELPLADFDKIMETNEDPPAEEYNTQKIFDDLSVYLAWTNTFAVPIHNGLGKSLAKYAVRDISNLPPILEALNKDLERSRAYYLGMMKRSGKSLKEIAETGAVPDEGQRTAMMHIDLDKMRGVNIDNYMERAAALKAIGNQRYGQGIKVYVGKKPRPYEASVGKWNQTPMRRQTEKSYFRDMGKEDPQTIREKEGTPSPKQRDEDTAREDREVAYDEFLKDMKSGKVKKVLRGTRKQLKADAESKRDYYKIHQDKYLEEMGKGPQRLPNLDKDEDARSQKFRKEQVEEYLEDMGTGPNMPPAVAKGNSKGGRTIRKENSDTYLKDMGAGPNTPSELTETDEKDTRDRKKRDYGTYLGEMGAKPKKRLPKELEETIEEVAKESAIKLINAAEKVIKKQGKKKAPPKRG